MAIKVFLDGANIDDMVSSARAGLAAGFTTNPTLMRKSGISDYEEFASAVLARIRDLPVSFEVFADDWPSMALQARRIASFGPNVYVKIPVTNTAGQFAGPLLTELSREGLKLNVTAIFVPEQVANVVKALSPQTPSVISVFAGRIADTGRDPMPIMREAVRIATPNTLAEVLWASPREVLNIYQAEECGCHIITVPNDLLPKLALRDKDLLAYSRETVRMFYDDALKSGFSLAIQQERKVAVGGGS
jgi:transaldolase